MCADVLVKYTETERLEEKEDSVVGCVQPLLESGLPTERTFCDKEKNERCNDNVLVEEVHNSSGHAPVVPASMHQQEPLQEPKLGDGEVTIVDILTSFLATDSDTDLGLLNHSDIVCTITNRECHGFGLKTVSDHHNELSLLKR